MSDSAIHTKYIDLVRCVRLPFYRSGISWRSLVSRTKTNGTRAFKREAKTGER